MTRATGDATTDRMGVTGQPVYMPPPREMTEPFAHEKLGATDPDPDALGDAPYRHATWGQMIAARPWAVLLAGVAAGLAAGIAVKSFTGLTRRGNGVELEGRDAVDVDEFEGRSFGPRAANQTCC
jgi:hypothetical protein